MEYWRGIMDWPLDPDWTCELCGQNHGLTWGFVNGQCRCNNCHTHYYMRDDLGQAITRPKWTIDPQYREAAQRLFTKEGTPIDTWSDETWDKELKPEITHAQ